MLPVAKKGDLVVGIDTHIVMVPSPGGPVPTPMPLPFQGPLQRELSTTVFVEDLAVATVGSLADNSPAHLPPGGPFQRSPSNEGKVQRGSSTVYIDDKAVARSTDPAMTCNDPSDAPNGVIIATSKVLIG